MLNKALPIMVFGMILAPMAAAQDGHYWDNQYGTKGELLGGLVVGDPADLSSTFYNPGWVALRSYPAVLLTTKAAEVYTLKIKEEQSGEPGPKSTTSTKSPGFLAGRFSSGEDEGWQWAYSYLQKVKFQYSSFQNVIEDFDVPSPRDHLWFSGESFRESDTQEYWMGVTFSRKLSKNIGLGFTPYGVYRKGKNRTQTAAQALDSLDNYAQIYDVNHYKFWHGRLLCKIGLAYSREKMNLGLTVTTPSVGIMGKGEVYQSSTFSGIDLDGNGEVDAPYLASNFQEDLSSSWRSPLSIAAGASWTWGKTGLFLTVEWFNSLSEHKILDPAEFTAQSTGETMAYDVQFGARSLFNYGLAFDQRFSEKFAMYGAFRSDYSSIPSDNRGEVQIATWNLWHISSGVSFTYKNIDFTGGLEYSFGSDEILHFSRIDSEDGGLDGEVIPGEISYRRLKGLVGFNLPFGTSSN